VILACIFLTQYRSVSRRTDGRLDDGQNARSILLSHVKTIKNASNNITMHFAILLLTNKLRLENDSSAS